MIIALDGPAASGKGTLAKALARHYGLPHLDTGLLYRAVGVAVAEAADDPNFEDQAVAAARTLDHEGIDADALSTAEAGIAASKIAHFEAVRAALRQYQRDFANQPGGAVLDGRDIGSRICPDAEVKLWVTASPKTRARRRTEQIRARGLKVLEADILAQILARDEADWTNPAGAFYPADDAHLLDTSEMDIKAALRAAIAIVEAARAGKGGSE